MSAALTMAEVRSGALESPGDLIRHVAGIIAGRTAPGPEPEVCGWLYRVSADMDATGGDLARLAVPAPAEEAARVAGEILGAAEVGHG